MQYKLWMDHGHPMLRLELLLDEFSGGIDRLDIMDLARNVVLEAHFALRTNHTDHRDRCEGHDFKLNGTFTLWPLEYAPIV